MSSNVVNITKKFGVFDINTSSNTASSGNESKSNQNMKTNDKKENSESKNSTSKTDKTANPTSTATPAVPVTKAAPKSFARRDHLRDIEIQMQSYWNEKKSFESNVDINKPKFFLNFPYPYMNGRLHLGHAFSLTKAEFTARFQKLQGKNVLFPFAFHCTGMPIQAAANKLRDEIKKFGNPPNFNIDNKDEEDNDNTNAQDANNAASAQSAESTIANKSKGKKTKLIVKGQSGPMRQWDILA